MITRNKNNKELLKTGNGKLGKTRNFIKKYFSFRSKIAQRMYIFILTLGLVVATLSYSYSPNIDVGLGKPSPRTIKANKSIEFEDVEKTEEDRNKNEADVEDVYVYDINVLSGEEGALYQIRYFYLLTGIVQKKEDKSFEERVDYMTNLLGNQYSGSIITMALNLSVDDLNLLLTKTQDIAREIMKEEIKPTEVDLARSEASSLVKADKDIKPENIPVITSVLEKNILPTAVFSPSVTEEEREEARLNTSPHMVTVLEGQTIVFEGEVISDTDILMLTRLGLLQTGFNWKRLLYIFFISSVALALFGFYIYKFDLNIQASLNHLHLIQMLTRVETSYTPGDYIPV